MSILNYLDHAEKKNKKEYFIHLIHVTLADGKVTDKESEMLHRIGKKMGFTDPEIDTLFTRTAKSSYIPPYELSKKFDQLYDIIKLVLADGKIDENEMHLARIFALTAGFQDEDIPLILNLLIEGIKNGKDEEHLLKAYKKKKKYL
jgi:uncharacterized tellurite resistance protein B-like protein